VCRMCVFRGSSISMRRRTISFRFARTGPFPLGQETLECEPRLCGWKLKEYRRSSESVGGFGHWMGLGARDRSVARLGPWLSPLVRSMREMLSAQYPVAR